SPDFVGFPEEAASFTPRGSGVRTPRRPPSAPLKAGLSRADLAGAGSRPMRTMVSRSAALAALLAGALMLQGCLVGAAVGTAGAVVGGGARATGAVVGA